MRADLTRERLRALMEEIARTAPRGRPFRVYLVGGGTAVMAGWRASSVDADVCADDDAVFRDIQGIKERLDVNVELARPEHFVPPLPGSNDRHVFLETIEDVSFYHYDPYAQVLSKVVRGFARDVADARCFLESGMVEAGTLRALVERIPDAAYARYPSLSRAAVERAVGDFVATA
jgi:hypothetical protein